MKPGKGDERIGHSALGGATAPPQPLDWSIGAAPQGEAAIDDKHSEIDGWMTISSTFEYDAAAGGGLLPIPGSDELSDDIERLAKRREFPKNSARSIGKN